MGPSASGKSTLMNILGCLDRPTGGSYRFRGRDVGRLRPDELAALRRESFGFVFQFVPVLKPGTRRDAPASVLPRPLHGLVRYGLVAGPARDARHQHPLGPWPGSPSRTQWLDGVPAGGGAGLGDAVCPRHERTGWSLWRSTTRRSPVAGPTVPAAGSPGTTTKPPKGTPEPARGSRSARSVDVVASNVRDRLLNTGRPAWRESLQKELTRSSLSR